MYSTNGLTNISNYTTTGLSSSENILTFLSPLNRIIDTVSIPKADATTDGYLSSTDWNTFNAGSTIPTLQQVLTSGNTALTSNIDISGGLAVRFLGELAIKRAATNVITTTTTGTILNLLPAKVAFPSIPSATKTNILYFDTISKEVSYGSANPTPASLYGDGSDGAVSFDNVSQYPFFASFDGVSTYTLIRDVWATTIFVLSGTTVITSGYRLFAQTSINNAGGLIHNNGSNASGSTAGAGGLGGFFKAGGNGATGLLAASAGANGVAQATPTAATWVGGLGGEGGPGRASNITFTGGMITSANLNLSVPANADGGARVTSNFVNYMTKYIVAATNWQMTPSIGGGGGAKSIIGTAASSGGGGGGGGVLFLASPIIFGSGSYQANGGIGGNASGTGGNFGGGGGGGGGICCIIARSIANNQYTADGANGGSSIFTGTGDYPIANANGTNTTLTQTLTLSPTQALSKKKLYMLTFHLQIAAGIGGSGINGITGYGMTWNLISGSRVEYATIAAPTRVQETWYGYYQLNEPDLVEDRSITIALSNLNTTARVIIDEIDNVNASNVNNPVTANIGTNRSNSTTNLAVTLANAPTAGNCVYSVFTRATGTLPVAGANNTLVNNQTVAPLMVSEINTTGQQANAMSHTTASAIAGFSVEINKTAISLEGSRGWDGKIVRIFG